MAFFGNTSAQQPAVEKRLANISDDAINSNQLAIPVPYLAGRAYITGQYISPAYNPRAVPIESQTGKDQSSTTGYKYFADFAMTFCMGGRRPVDAVYKVIVDSDIAWSGNITRGNAHKEVITVPNFGVIHLYWGDETQPIDNILLTPRSVPIGGGNPQDSTTWPPNSGDDPFSGLPNGDPNPYSGHYDAHPAYRGQCYAVFKDWKLGRDRTSIQNIALELKRGCPWVNGGFVTSNDLGVVPAAILYDWLTDTRFGMALADTQLNIPSFISLFNQQNAQGMRLAPVITTQSEFRQIVAQFLEYYDGWIRRNGDQLEVGMWSHGTITSAGTLTDDDLLDEPELEPTGLGPTLNEFTVVYSDRDHHYNEYPQSHRDPNNFRITGGPRPIVLQRPWMTDAALAKKYVREYGAIQALPTSRGTLKVKREWLTRRTAQETHDKLPGNVFLYQSGFYLLQFYLRILEIEYEADNSSGASLTVEWERSIWPSLYVPPPFPNPGGITIGARSLWKSRIIEMPYLLQDHQFLTQIAALAIKGNVETIGYRVWLSTDGGLTYEDVSNENTFPAFGRSRVFTTNAGNCFVTLYGPALELVVSQTPQQQANDRLLMIVEDEIMSVGDVVPIRGGLFQINILRGRFETMPATHGVHGSDRDAYFILREQLHLIDNANFLPGRAVKFKLQPYTADEDFDFDALVAIDYTIKGFPTIDPPVFDPPSQSFRSSLPVQVSPQAGFTCRFTQDGSFVDVSDPVFPPVVLLTGTTLIRARWFAPDGRRSVESTAAYTKIEGNDTRVAAVAFSFTGTRGFSSGDLTMACATAGAAIKYRKNGGPILNYATPVHLNCNPSGDVIEAWAIKPGMIDASHRFFDNTLQYYGGGGHGPPLPP